MASINFIPLTALQPVELHYQYNKDEKLNSNLISYAEGYNFYTLDALQGYQDVAINSGSCLILTSAVSLNSLFATETPIDIKQTGGTVQLINYQNKQYFCYDSTTGYIRLSSAGNNIFINPVIDSNQVEFLIDGMYLQINASYPYEASLSKTPLEGDQLYRQLFNYIESDGTVTISTKTADGTRFLSFCSDNILRATGITLNSSSNNYTLSAIDVTNNILEYGHLPNNAWVTYFMDLETETENKSLSVNKVFNDNNINLLIDFPYNSAVTTGKAFINVANLKSDYTPAGSPAPVDNTYKTSPVTSNVPLTTCNVTTMPVNNNKLSQTVTIYPISTQLYTVGATVTAQPPTSTSGLPVLLSVLSGPATISNNNITLTGPGTVVLVADQTGNDFYLPATATTSFDILNTSQSITFLPVPVLTYGTPSVDISAVASSGLPVTYSYVSGPGALVGTNTVNILSAGTIVVQANSVGNSQYTATSTKYQIVVNQSPQTITFNSIPNQVYSAGATYTITPPTASSNLPVTTTLRSDSPAGTTLVGNVITFGGVGQIGLVANQPGNQNYLPATVVNGFNVAAGSQTITPFTTISNVTYPSNTPITYVTPTASTGLPVTVGIQSGPAYISGNTVIPTDVGTITLSAQQPGNSNYGASPIVTTSFNVTVGNISTTAFKFKIDTTLTGSNNTPSNQFKLYLNPDLNYNFCVDWGDGNKNIIAGTSIQSYLHTYTTPGVYTISIAENTVGGFPAIYCNNSGDAVKITSITQWGNNTWTSFNNAFNGCINLKTITATDYATANTNNVTDFSYAWNRCSSLTTFPLIDTSSGTDFSYAWNRCSSLTTFPLINTSNGTDFSYAWNSCTGLTSFPLINTSNGTNFSYTWQNCGGLLTFPLINTAKATTFIDTWNTCEALATFPLLVTSNVTNFDGAWSVCQSLTAFPSINTSAGTSFNSTWSYCAKLSSTPFPSLNLSNMQGVGGTLMLSEANLTVQSYSNILTSLSAFNTNTHVTFDGGVNIANTAGQTARTFLINTRDWNITDGSSV